MNLRHIALACGVTALALTTACSSSPPRSERNFESAGVSSRATQYGHVSQIEIVSESARTSGGGAVLGAVIGAVVGNQIGSGSGRTAATGVGLVGGAVAGNAIEQRNKRDGEVYRVSVRMDNGRTGQFDYDRIGDLRVGDRIRVEDGQLHRV
ncbi:MAG TPA: glycine zipper 2TM domain-containing protein [Lysobacter sp.]|nr:glycine zipper 2TM domain-containing protein [Lysobacter sp.]